MSQEQEQEQEQQLSWPDLLGSSHWSGLLDPLVDLSLLRLILRCGDLCQVTYDSFNNDPHSMYCGSCRYSPRTLLPRVQFPDAHLFSPDLLSHLYATSSLDLPADFLLFSLSREAWSRESNWIGYVAVTSDAYADSTGRREIYVAWRGTIRTLEWVDVLQPELVKVRSLLAGSRKDNDDDDDGDDEIRVMKGWYTIYTSSDPKSSFNVESARVQFMTKVKELVSRFKNDKVSVICTGHSLGASLAILSAFDIVENGLSKVGESEYIQVCAIVFGSPQIGNKAFNDRLESLPNLRVLHIKHGIDLIPLYPSGLLGFVFTGVELVIDCRKSPYLKDSKNPSDWHNLQGILHTLAGWNGKDKGFEFRVKRSFALVNKSSDYLKDEYLIPGSWWVENNKGMVLGRDGEWGLAPPDDEDIPRPPTTMTRPRNVGEEEKSSVGELGSYGSPVKEKESKGRVSSFICCFRAS